MTPADPRPRSCAHNHTSRQVGCVSCVLVFDRPADPDPRPAPPASETLRKRDIKLLRDTVSMLAHFMWHRQIRPGDHFWSIPVDRERDWDCILTDAIDELERLRAEPPPAPPAVPWECPDCGYRFLAASDEVCDALISKRPEMHCALPRGHREQHSIYATGEAEREAASPPDLNLDDREARQRMSRAPLTQQGAATPGEDFGLAAGNVAKSQLDPSGAVASSTLPSNTSPSSSPTGWQDMETPERTLRSLAAMPPVPEPRDRHLCSI